MSKTTALIIIIVAIVAIFGGVALWYFQIANEGGPGINATSTETGIGRFFSFGNSDNNSNNVEVEDTPSSENVTNTDDGGEAPVLREISSSPVSGFSPAWDNIDGPLVRYIEQETGNIYEAPLNVMSKDRISNQTIPRVRESLWFPGGAGFVARYLSGDDSIESFSATIKKATSTDEEGSLSGRFLPKNISSVAIINPKSATSSKSTIRIAYAIKSTDTDIYTSNSDGTKQAKVSSIKLNEINIMPINENNILIETKPSGKSHGMVFSLNAKTGALDKILGSYLGLKSSVSEDGNTLVYSALSQGLPMLYVLNRKTGENTSLNLRTFADKCSWSIKNKEKIFCAVPKSIISGINYPDSWYQGKVAFNDSVYEIDTKTFSKTKVVDSDKLNLFVDIDLISPSDDDKFIILRDKNTRALWSVKI